MGDVFLTDRSVRTDCELQKRSVFLLSEGDIGLTISTFRTDCELACSKHSPRFFPALSLALHYLNAWNRLTVNRTHSPYRSVQGVGKTPDGQVPVTVRIYKARDSRISDASVTHPWWIRDSLIWHDMQDLAWLDIRVWVTIYCGSGSIELRWRLTTDPWRSDRGSWVIFLNIRDGWLQIRDGLIGGFKWYFLYPWRLTTDPWQSARRIWVISYIRGSSVTTYYGSVTVC